MFTALFHLDYGPALLGKHNANLFHWTSIDYLALTLVSAALLPVRPSNYYHLANIPVLIDILFLTLLMHASGGLGSGIGILLAISVAAGSLLTGGRSAMTFAACASLAILSEQIYADLSNSFDTTTYTYAGMLGASFFATALLAYVMAIRAERSEAIAAERGTYIHDLRVLNEHVIQHLQAGIIISDSKGRILTMNAAALRAFELSQPAPDLASVSGDLYRHYVNWCEEPRRESATLDASTPTEIHLRFTRLQQTRETYTLVFLEDSTITNQRVQQKKLASLGKLTASIAHEIRNPLSAIGHAGQLLAECPSLGAEDRRLTEIIQDHTKRVDHIIENVLQLSRKTPSRRETIALIPWLRKFIHDYKRQQPRHSLAVKLIAKADPLQVRIDTSHLKQILDNLCDNALLHGGENPEIRLVAGSHRQRPYLEVRDNGPGIDQQQSSRIFEPFFSTSPRGTGLGLYIAKGLAELNQATLEYEAPPEGGSCFRIDLPADDSLVIAL